MKVNKNIEQYILIKNALMRKGMNQSDVARTLNMCTNSIHNFMYGKNKSTRFNNWVKENLNIDLPKHTSKRRKAVK